MKINEIENIFLMKMFTDTYQKSFGKDSPTFSVMFESLLNAFNGNKSGEFNLNQNNESALNSYSYCGEDILSQDAKNMFSELDNDIRKVKNKLPKTKVPEAIDKAVKKAAKKYRVDERFIKAVIKQESSFDPYSKSSAGAMGLMQLMPATAKSLGVNDPYNIDQNVDGGTKYLKDMLDSYGNCKELALAAYNAGPNAVRRRNVSSVSDIYKMPRETRGYVKQVMKYYKTQL